MPNDNLKKYYSYLKSNGADVAPTYDSFVSTLSNEANAKKYYSYLKSNGFDTPPSYDQFANALGIKKKDLTASGSGTSSSDRLSKTTTKPTVSSSSRRFEGVTEEPISQKKFRTDDYIDQVQKAEKTQTKPQAKVVNTLAPNATQQTFDVITNKEANKMMAEDFGEKEFKAYSSINDIPSSNKLRDLDEETTADILNKQFEGTNLEFKKLGWQLTVTSKIGQGINSTILNEKTIDLSDPDADKKLKSFVSTNLVKKSEREQFENAESVEDLVQLVGSNPNKFKASLLEGMDVDSYFSREREILNGEMARAKADTYDSDLKLYEQKVIKFNQDVKSGNMSKADFDVRSTELENERKSLNQRKDIMSNAIGRAEKIDSLTDNLEKAKVITAAEREKQGTLTGLVLRGIGEGLTDVSQAMIDFGISGAAAITDAKTLADSITPGEYERLKSLGFSDDEIKNEIQKSVKNRANKVLRSIPDAFGMGTTEEYVKSTDRNIIEQAIYSLGESLGAVGGGLAAGSVGAGFFAMSYNALEDQMRGPQFDALSENEKKIMSVPYGLVIGALEKLGAKVATGAAKNKTLAMFSDYIMSKTFSSLPKNASLLEIKSAIDKSVAASVANGMLKITGAGIVEGGTEFTQQIFEGIEKDVANRIIQSNQLEKAKEEGGGTVSKEIYNQIVQNKFFKDAADLSTTEGIGQLLKESGNAFLVGAVAGAMGSASSVGVIEPISNKVSNNKFALYRDIILNDEAREGAISAINKKVEDNQVTREQADKEIESINKAYPILRQIPTDFSVGAQREAFGLLTERDQLNKEIKDKDPNLVARQKERVDEINEQLKGLSYAVQEQTTSEVPVQSGTAVSGEVEERKPETGLEEAAKKGQEEVNQYIADMGAEARIGGTINPLMDKMANAEYINDNDIDNAIEAIFNEVESLDNSDYSAETKAAVSEKLLNIAEKLDNYEFRTKTETVATTKAGAATTTRRTSEAVQKIRAEKYFDGVQATVNGQEVTLKDNKGRVEAQMPNGEVVVLDTPTMEIAEDGFEFDDNDALVAVTVADRLGNTVRLTGDQALDFAIRDRENKLGVVEQAEFDTVYQEVEKKYIKEAPSAQVTAEETVAEEAVAEEQQPTEKEVVVEEEEQLDIKPSEENRFTERNAKVMAVKYPSRKAIIKAALNVIKALPSVKIYLHEDSDQYAKELSARTGKTKQYVVNQDSFGAYIDGEIHINISRASVVTLMHEAFHHAFMTLGVKNGMFIDLAKGLRSIIKDKETLAELDEFIKDYYSDFDQKKLDEKIKEFKLANPSLSQVEIDQEVDKITKEFESEIDQETLELRAEEFATQLGAILADNKEELTTTKLTQFKALINRIAKKIGLGIVFSEAANSKEAADFINTITRGLTTGDIVEGKFQPDKTGKIKRQAVTIMEGKESMKKFGLAPGKNVTRKIGEALEARQRAKYGTIAQKDNSPEARKKISNWMVDEVKYFVELMGDKSGKGWYGELYQNSLDAMSNIFPEMKTDQNARDLFTMLVAITSDGEKVMSNFRLASEAYDYYKKNGVMPDTLSGHRPTSFVANLKRINNLLTEYNGDIAAIKKDLMDVRSIQDINKERKAEGLPPLKTSWPVSFKAPFAASLFGAKLGMFYSNLSGNEAYPTLDRWWSRTFNRYRGTLIPALKSGFSSKGEAIGLDRFKQLLGTPGMSNEEALLAAKSYRDSYAAKEYKNGTEIEKAANTIYKTAFENLNDAPFNGGDRKFMYDTISDAVNKLNKQGYDLSIADVQAILWYFEKNLYKTLGVQAKIEGISYEDAANYTYNKWKESGQKFNYEIKAEEEGQAVEDADEDIEEEKKSIKFQKGNKKTPNLAQNETGRIQPERTGDGRGRLESWKLTPLEGAPAVPGINGPDPQIVGVAEKYAADNGIDLKRQSEYVEVDVERAKRIADAYEQMADDPQNPKVKEAYQDLINQTIAQYQALADAGYKFWFTDSRIPSNEEYLSTPYNALRDLRENKEMGVYPTLDGYGEGEITQEQIAANPMLADTGIKWPVGGLDGKMMPVLANDLFRAVHDAFGHGLEGAGFRARGEENAWQAHVRLFTGPAVAAITSETRGQNSWLNFGPFGEANRTAKIDDTVFAEQKVGLMPEWTWTEGRAGDMEAPKKIKFQKAPKKEWIPTPVKNMNESPIAKNSDKVRDAAVKLIKGLINVEEYRDIVNKFSPIKSIGTLFAPASTEHMELALGKKADKLMAPVVDENGNKLKKVGTRLDIPSYLNKNAWVVTVHDERIKNGPVVSYRNAVKLKNVEFSTDPRMALNIAAGLMGKSTFARMVGEMEDIPGNTAEEQGLNAQLMVEDIMNDPNWVQVGMNPFRHSFFWNRETGMPVVSADEVIQIGGLVYAKNAKEVSPNSDEFTVYGKYDEAKNKVVASEEPMLDKSGKTIKFQKAPKILGVKPTVVIVNDEQKALVDQIKLEIRAQREQKKAYKQVLASISARVTALKSKGNISVKQFDAIMKNLNRLNFDNETKVQAFIDYVSRALANADYVEKVARAHSLNKKIKKSLKGTANPFAVVAKMFTTLDSRWVDNIDDHIAVAQMILDGVKPSTARRGVLTLKEEPDLQIIAEYIDKEQKAQTQMMLDRLRSRYEMITGKSAGSLDAEAMITQLDALKPDEDQTDKIKEQIDQKFAEYASMLSEEDPQVIVDAVNVDTDMITWRESVKILDALDTYFTNGSTAGIDSLMGSYQGIVNAKRFKYKSNPMTIALSKTLAKLKFENFTGFTRILERKFRSLEKSLAYEKASGINDIVTGVNRADFEAAKKQKEYVKKFEKVKDFNSNENIYERGVIADLIRTNAGIDQDAEFDRLVNILIDSKDMLLASQDQTKVEMGKLYDKVFKKLGLYEDGITIDDVLSKATKTNVDAVEFVVDMFADKYDLLSDTALGVYNVMLGQDINYTPKTYMNIRNEQSVDSDPLSGKDSFSLGAYSNAGFNKNEAGVLMPITRPKDLKNAGKYVDLNFDNNMFRSYRLALTDAYTAKSIRQLNSFFNTKENEDILASEKDFDVIKAALSDYINTAKGKNFIGKITSQEVDKFLNLISTFGSVRALVGVGQALSQFASGMSNTIMNAGEHIRPSDFTKKAFDFMNRSGQPIANVGENDILISLANFDKAIERATVGKNMAEIGLDKFAKFNSKAFQIFVSNPDAAARRLAWMAYYRKYISKNNLGPIDLNGEPNADAAAYAQGMVDRSMDATDARIRGDIYRTQNVWAKAVRGMLFPFSSFGMNQKTRMWGDLTKLVTFNADFDTARSLASIGAEMFVYNLIRYQMGRLILYAAMNMLGYDDEEQDELYEELKRNMISSSWNKAIVDTFSPLALFDNWTLELANWMMATTGVGEPSQKEADDFIKEENDIRKIKGLDPLTKEQEERKRDQYMTENSMQFYISNEANWGVLGIQFEKASESYEIYKAITTGKYTDEYGRDVYFDSEAREKLKWIALLKTGGQIVPLREIDQVANKSLKFLKKGNTMSEKKYDMITEVKRKFGKVDPVLEKLAEKKNKITTIENEIAWINEHGGLKGPKEKMEYAKLLDLISTPSKDMLEKIQRGGTAQEIFDQELKK